MLSIAAWAGLKVAAGNYEVADDKGKKIGNSSAINGGDTIGYVDDPNTSHPPDANAVYNWNSARG